MTGSGGVEGEEQRQQPIPAKENDGGEQKAGKLADGKQQLLDRRHFHEHFDTDAYLQDFYSRVDEPAMQLVLFHLPNLVARLGPLDSLLDFGCGPTIHVAVCFRETAQNIFLADYLPQNRAELSRWMDGHSHFDWSSVLRIIAAREAIPFTELANMEQQAREKVRAILHCDCLACPAVQQTADASGPMGSLLLPTFGAITTFFTLEYCCLDRDEYEAALRRVCQHLGPGGRLIMGGVLEETWCAFGGRQYKCLFLELDFVLDSLRTAGLELERGPLGSELLYEQDGMFLLVAKKRVN